MLLSFFRFYLVQNVFVPVLRKKIFPNKPTLGGGDEGQCGRFVLAVKRFLVVGFRII